MAGILRALKPCSANLFKARAALQKSTEAVGPKKGERTQNDKYFKALIHIWELFHEEHLRKCSTSA